MPRYGNYYLLEEKEYPQLIEKIQTSIKNYNKYLFSDKFTENDIIKFNEKALNNLIMERIDQTLYFNNNWANSRNWTIIFIYT